MNEQKACAEKGPRCFATHPLSEGPCEKAALVEFRGLRYCEAHGREIEAAERVNLGVRAHNVLRRWAENPEALANPVLAGILEDAVRKAEAKLRRAETRQDEEAVADRATLPEKVGGWG